MYHQAWLIIHATRVEGKQEEFRWHGSRWSKVAQPRILLPLRPASHSFRTERQRQRPAFEVLVFVFTVLVESSGLELFDGIFTQDGT